jgi:SAM-dependent methyltransferase
VSQLQRVRTAFRRRVFRQFEPKGDAEFDFWRKTQDNSGGRLENDYFEQLFTDQFELTREYFSGKRMLDIGCGPRGSLEWATMAVRRVGLDPLADRYRDLGISEHAMEYCSAHAEKMPFPADSFDVISSLNSLDHVDDLPATLDEVRRVLVPGGSFLVEVEFGHRPTDTEPVEIPKDLVDSLQPDFRVLLNRQFAASDHRIHSAYLEGVPYREGRRYRAGVIVAHLVKR